jgi:hypothetical protein
MTPQPLVALQYPLPAVGNATFWLTSVAGVAGEMESLPELWMLVARPGKFMLLALAMPTATAQSTTRNAMLRNDGVFIEIPPLKPRTGRGVGLK